MKKKTRVILSAALFAVTTFFTVGCSGAKAPESIGLNNTAQLLGKIGETYSVADNLVFEEGVSTEVTYTSSDTNIAEVSEDGMVTAKDYGVATITITSSADESVSATMDVAVCEYIKAYAGTKYISAMGCDVAVDVTLAEDGTFTYYRAPMYVAIEGGGQMPELSDGGIYQVEGTNLILKAEQLGEFKLTLSLEEGACVLSGSIPTGGASTDMQLK